MTDPNPPLFNYYLATQPQPLQAGDDLMQFNGTVNVHIAPPSGGNAYTNQILIAVPVGDGGVFQDSPTFTINTGKWVITSTQKIGGKQIGLIADQQYATCTINCQAQADYGVDYNLVVAMAGAVTATEGNYQTAVQENSGTTSDPSGFTLKNTAFTLSVVPPQLYLTNLVTYATGAPTVPKTEFAAGMDVNLAWESNGTWFQVFKKGDTTPFYAGTQTTCTLTGGVDTDTSFFLIASMTGDPSGDTPNFTTIYLYDSISVTITDPILTPTSVSTSGAVSVGTDLTVSGTANVTGQTTLGTAAANTLTTTGEATLASAVVQGDLGVSGATTMASANVNSGLSVTGDAQLASATVSGQLTGAGSAQLNNLTVTGGLNGQSASVALLGSGAKLIAATILPSIQVHAYTDGFAIAHVPGPQDASSRCFAYGIISTAGNSFYVQGGTLNSLYNPNSICIPVPAGTTWGASGFNDAGNQEDSNIEIWWFPMGGSSSSTEPTFRVLSEIEAAEQGIPLAAPPPAPDFGRVIERRRAAAEEFMRRHAQALGVDLDDEVRRELSELLLRF